MCHTYELFRTIIFGWTEKKTNRLRPKKSFADKKLSFHQNCSIVLHFLYIMCEEFGISLKINSDKKPTKLTKKTRKLFYSLGSLGWCVTACSCIKVFDHQMVQTASDEKRRLGRKRSKRAKKIGFWMHSDRHIARLCSEVELGNLANQFRGQDSIWCLPQHRMKCYTTHSWMNRTWRLCSSSLGHSTGWLFLQNIKRLEHS